jgi:signal transduction histidine kinase
VNPHTIEAGIGSLIAVPLISQGQPVGVMYVGSYKTQQFDESAVQIISALANQAALAISNARLFGEIAESRDQLQAILDSADDGMLIFGPSSRIVMVNPCLETMWNVPHGWLNDRRLIELLDQPEVAIAEKLGYAPEALRALLQHLSTAGGPNWSKHIYPLPSQSPTRYVERTCLPVLDAERVPIGWMIILREVTEELELQRMRDDLTNTIVHDLRSPLSSILGSLYFLEELVETNPDSPTGQALTISIRSANKLMNLVNSLLDIARLSTGQAPVELQAQHLESVLDAAVEYLRPLALDSEISLIRQVDPDLPLVLIDEDKINRVLINLIDNALKFTPRGGQVVVSAGRWTNGNGLPAVRCVVRDTGPGIPPEYRSRIFDRFVQIANRAGRRRGTGIGLNFCQLAVEAHGGKIWVEDAPGGGSEFSFTLQAVTDYQTTTGCLLTDTPWFYFHPVDVQFLSRSQLDTAPPPQRRGCRGGGKLRNVRRPAGQKSSDKRRVKSIPGAHGLYNLIFGHEPGRLVKSPIGRADQCALGAVLDRHNARTGLLQHQRGRAQILTDGQACRFISIEQQQVGIFQCFAQWIDQAPA